MNAPSLDDILDAVREHCLSRYGVLPKTLTVVLHDGRGIRLPIPVQAPPRAPSPQEKEPPR